MDNIFLFSYGTLSNEEYIQLLLKRLPDYREAALFDYALFVHPGNGYLYVRPARGQTVKGRVFEISNQELRLIDLWEDVPLYRRELLDIQMGNSNIKAFVYTQNHTKGLPVSAGIINDRLTILKAIEEFLNWVENNPIA